MSVRKILAGLVLAFFAAPSLAATAGSWTCSNAEPSGSYTIDAGSNRKFLVILQDETNTTTTVSTFTIGGQAATETFQDTNTTASADHQRKAFIWNEAAIAAMSGTGISYTDDNALTKFFCSVTIQDTNQSNLSNYTQVAYSTGSTAPAVTTTSSSGDLVVVELIGSTASFTVTGWETLSEKWDQDGGGQPSWFAGASGDGGDATTTLTLSAAAEVTLASLVFPNAATAPSFSAAPSCSATINGVSCTYTASATSTAYGVGVSPGDGAPTCTQIKAGQNDGGAAALATGSDANTGTSDTISVTGTNPIAKMDYHFCLNNAGGDSAVDSSQSDKLRSPRSGFALVTIASISATGICDYDSYFTPDCAVGDVFEYEDDTNENADCNVSIGTDGDITLTPVSGGECDGRPTFEISYEDVSSATDGLFTAPTVGNFTTDDTAYINNSAPVCSIEPTDAISAFTIDVAISDIDLNFLGGCVDDDGDSLTFSITSGSLPTGLSQSGTGNADVTGTPTVEDEVGAAITFSACDPAGDCDTFDVTFYVIDTWTVTNIVGQDVATAESLVVADAPWREFDPGVTVSGYTCDAGAENLILTQDPAASAEAAASDQISVTLSISCPSSTYTGTRKVVYQLSDVTGLTKWVDYIPVVVQTGCNAGTFDEDGCWAVTPLSSTTGKTAWVDYTPVYVVTETANKWRYENNGWIPVDTLTP